MADDWEAEDWEAEELPPLPGVAALNGKAAPGTEDLDASKFAGEDEDINEPPAWMASVPKTQQPKEVKNKYADKDKPKTDLDVPLDDPAAERARQQRLIEAADFEAAQELFGGLNLDTMPAETVKDLEKLAEAISRKYVLPHSGSKHYKALLKGILKHSLPPLPLQETKDLESTLAGIRTDKLKEEQAVARQSTVKKGGKKKLNTGVGKSGGSAGLDDLAYEDVALDDEYDFM